MRQPAFGCAADPLRVAGPGGNATVQRLRVLQGDVGPRRRGDRSAEQCSDVERFGVLARERRAGWNDMPEAPLLRQEVVDVAKVRGGSQRDAPVDSDAA